MSISGVSGNLASFYTQRRQEFQALQNSVSSGNIGQAQQALSALQANTPASQTASGSGSQTSSQGGGWGPGVQIKTDFSALSSAVQAGDIAGAQNALTSLQNDFSNAKAAVSGSQSSQVSHHHHHHRGGNEATGSSTTAQAGATAGSASSGLTSTTASS